MCVENNKGMDVLQLYSCTKSSFAQKQGYCQNWLITPATCRLHPSYFGRYILASAHMEYGQVTVRWRRYIFVTERAKGRYFIYLWHLRHLWCRLFRYGVDYCMRYTDATICRCLNWNEIKTQHKEIFLAHHDNWNILPAECTFSWHIYQPFIWI